MLGWLMQESLSVEALENNAAIGTSDTRPSKASFHQRRKNTDLQWFCNFMPFLLWLVNISILTKLGIFKSSHLSICKPFAIQPQLYGASTFLQLVSTALKISFHQIIQVLVPSFRTSPWCSYYIYTLPSFHHLERWKFPGTKPEIGFSPWHLRGIGICQALCLGSQGRIW